jgi:Zn-dependent protease
VNLDGIRNPRKGLICVSSAGIIANMLLAFAAFLLDRVLSPSPSGILAQILYYLAQINIMLAAFNLIPIPPLDGSKILMGFAPAGVQGFLLRLEPYGFFVIIGLLYLGALDPLIAFFRWCILALIRVLIP